MLLEDETGVNSRGASALLEPAFVSVAVVIPSMIGGDGEIVETQVAMRVAYDLARRKRQIKGGRSRLIVE